METESMTPQAGSILPSQRMSGKTGYGKGGDPESVFMADEYKKGMTEIAESSMSPSEKKAAIVKLHQRQREQQRPYKH